MNRKRIKLTRFRDLPDEIVQHILSFLTVEDLARVGCVSKRCSKLHLSTPSLNFDEFSDASVSTCDQRKELLGSLERFLVRRGCNKLQCFRFSWCNHGHDEDKPQCCPEDLNVSMARSIDTVVRCNVKELHLEINLPPWQTPYVEFPVFRCESLRHLYVKGMFIKIETPLSYASFSNLERLELTLVNIADEGFFKWMSHSCQRMKELLLEDVYGFWNGNIESSSLKSFTFILHEDFEYCHYNLTITCEKLEDVCVVLDMPFHTVSYGGALYISAPNLKNLKWSGHVMKFQNLSEVTSLEKAEIDLAPGVDNWGNFRPPHIEARPERAPISLLKTLIHSVRSAKVLDLTESTMKCLLEGGLTPLLQLHNVCCLRIRGLSLMDDDVPAMVSFLEAMPNLASLHIEAARNDLKHLSSSVDKFYWEWQNLAFIHHLKEVNIELSNGTNGVILTQYILDNAINLQKMIIHHLPEQSYKVRSYKWKVTSDAKVIFVVREDEHTTIDDEFDIDFFDAYSRTWP